MAADAPEGGNAYQQVVAVSAREGAPLDAAALWAGEVDLTQLAWTDSQTGRPVSAAELLIWGLRENMEVYAIGIQAATEATVIFYAVVDDAWVEMGITTTSQKASWRGRLPWNWAGRTAVALAVCMGLSRLYVGVHYPSDVITGGLIGAACAWAALRTTDWLCAWAAQRKNRKGAQ